ncbi:MAG TPA: tripartite tricarboxylate transporter substrate binding protein [Casimicrobiaceae bacterium]|jgi:tripartite-type tricarboxylate transporter receptor subunit TctC
MTGRKTMRVLAAIALALTAMTSLASAQDGTTAYPNRPIKIVVCVPAGGGVDTVARVIAKELQEKLGQPVVVENRAGAAGNIGADFVFHAKPDGYTLLAAQPAPLTVNPLLYKDMTFDPSKFVPVGIMTSAPNVLMVRSDFPAKTAQEFMAYAKANPGKINFGSQGIGTTSHLTTMLFQEVTGTSMVHVPFKGTAPALNALIGGYIDMIFMELASANKLAQGGQARILAVATDKRIPNLPDVPTFDELGVKGFASATWNAIAAPPGTPPEIIEKLNDALNDALNSPGAVGLFHKLNLQPEPGSPSQAASFIHSESAVWGDVIVKAHIQPH